jgi:L-malate glycosyltransferase
MKIHQILPNLAYGDAIGEDTLALKRIFGALGHDSRIYADVIHRKLQNEAESRKQYKAVSSAENILIYHFSIGSEITDYVMSIPDRVIIIFHNITPAYWFFGNSPHMTEVTAEGMNELSRLKNRCIMAWADSEYNASILREAGYKNVRVLPIIIDLSRLDVKPDPVFSRQWKSNHYTWTFVGRISPNKCHQDIIRAFTFYKKHVNPKSRLMLVGENRNCWRYTQMMTQLLHELGTGDVYFTGMIEDRELVSTYNFSNLFICMSEHEGFCVPLLEAMYFDVPVVAYNAGAVKETMGDAGLVLDTKNPVEIAELAELIRRNAVFKDVIIKTQQKRLHEFCSRDMTKRVEELLKEAIQCG